MKYKSRYFYVVSMFSKKSFDERFGKKIARRIRKKAKREYKELTEKAMDIGSKNPMAHNLYFALAIVSFYTANKELLKKEDITWVINEIFESKPMDIMYKKMDMRDPKCFKKIEKSIRKSAEWAEIHREEYPDNWEFTFDEEDKVNISYVFTKCPIAKFFEENNMADLTPMICEIDFKMMEKANGVLKRKYTLGNGDDKCDFFMEKQ